MRLALTDLTVKNLAAPTSGQRTYLDQGIPGFGIRVSQGGTKTFTLMYGPARRLITIGRYPVITLSQARQKAKAMLAEKTLGIHQETPRTSFQEAYDQFLKAYRAKNRAKTVYEMERIAKRHLLPKFRRQQVGEISTHDLTRIIDQLIDTPRECSATFTAARTLFRWMAQRRLISRSPLENVPVPVKNEARIRVLTDDELVAVWRACDSPEPFNPEFAGIVKMLILTGQRKGQVSKMRGEWIAGERVVWPAEAMKSKRAHTIPLAPMASATLERFPQSGFVFLGRSKDKPFNGFSKAKADFDRRANIPPWTLHDLRRTFSTGIAKLGVLPHIKEHILAHGSAKDAVEAIYDLHRYENEMMQALQLWETHVQALLSNLESTNARDNSGGSHQVGSRKVQRRTKSACRPAA